MTGEITLRGRVLAIGGVKEKLLAAKQHEMEKVILPEVNKNDVEEVKKELKLDPLKIAFVKTMDDVVNEIFGKNIFLAKAKKRKPTKKK